MNMHENAFKMPEHARNMAAFRGETASVSPKRDGSEASNKLSGKELAIWLWESTRRSHAGPVRRGLDVVVDHRSL